MKSKHKSWYQFDVQDPVEQNYISLLTQLFKVMNSKKEWVAYEPTSWQLKYHSDSLVVQAENAKDRLVIKCRGGSYTTSSVIDKIMACVFFENHTVPIVKLTLPLAQDIIELAYSICMHSNDVIGPDGKSLLDKEFIRKNKTASTLWITPTTKLQAYPATNKSAENIRGARLLTAMIDEANFCDRFEDIFTAAQDADSGADEDGFNLFQIDVGTTLKGQGTNFFKWYRTVEKDPDGLGFILYKLPVFAYQHVNIERDLLEQKHLIPLVHWISIKEMEKKRKRNIHKFKEEFMAMPVADNAQLIPLEEVQACENINLMNDLNSIKNKVVRGGIDFGMTNDLTAIVLFYLREDGKWVQFFKQTFENMLMPIQEQEIIQILDALIGNGNQVLIRTDQTGIGASITQSLNMKYPTLIEGIWFSTTVEYNNIKMPFKKRLYDNIRDKIMEKSVELIPDEMQQDHLCGITVTYDLNSEDSYHGDLAPAIGLAFLPKGWKKQNNVVKSQILKKQIAKMGENPVSKDPRKMNINDKLKFFKSQTR